LFYCFMEQLEPTPLPLHFVPKSETYEHRFWKYPFI
jgi:hypothetical protein